MNWTKINEESYRAFSEFHREGNFKCSEDDFLTIVQEHGEKLMGISMEDLYDFFDDKGIYVQIRNTESSLNGKLTVWQWRINNSSWSTESFMCRKASEEKAFEIAFLERDKQWDNII